MELYFARYFMAISPKLIVVEIFEYHKSEACFGTLTLASNVGCIAAINNIGIAGQYQYK